MYYMSAPLVRFWKSNIAIISVPQITPKDLYERATPATLDFQEPQI